MESPVWLMLVTFDLCLMTLSGFIDPYPLILEETLPHHPVLLCDHLPLICNAQHKFFKQRLNMKLFCFFKHWCKIVVRTRKYSFSLNKLFAVTNFMSYWWPWVNTYITLYYFKTREGELTRGCKVYLTISLDIFFQWPWHDMHFNLAL